MVTEGKAGQEEPKKGSLDRRYRFRNKRERGEGNSGDRVDTGRQ